jgi:murein DD-endopeptidase MepM/ murein hydrolase activator NlpD
MSPEKDPAQERFQRAALLTSAVAGVCVLAMVASQAFTPRPLADATAATETSPAAVPKQAEIVKLAHADFAAADLHFDTAEGELGRGDTLSDLLIDLGATPAEAHRALQPVFEAEHIDARRVRPGLSATLTFVKGQDTSRLLGVSLRSERDFSVLSRANAAGEFEATKLQARLSPQPLRVSGEVTTSLYEAALEGGAGDQQVVDFARIFAYDIDFQREIHPGDRFEIVYESLVDERGTPVRLGEVIFARLDGHALTRDFYFHIPSDDGVSDYFDSQGNSATKFLMKTPINGARLSSHFGNRRHPISGYTRLHKGTDFAAPTGTPVYAAGHGTIERASRWGGYGHYVRIRHANGYKTAYAHLSRYARGIRAGRTVRQGDVIGYVGSTGASTGPHLHYEVMVRGMHVNAMKLDLPTGRKLSEDEEMLEEFLARKREIDQIRRALGAEIEVAGSGEDTQDG